MTFQNQVTLKGFIGEKSKVRTASNQSPYARLSARTEQSWQDPASGETKTRTSWHRCVAWARLAYVAAKLPAGSAVEIQGELRSRVAAEHEGATTGVKRWITEVHILAIKRLDDAKAVG